MSDTGRIGGNGGGLERGADGASNPVPLVVFGMSVGSFDFGEDEVLLAQCSRWFGVETACCRNSDKASSHAAGASEPRPGVERLIGEVA